MTAAVIRLNPECGLRVLAGPPRSSLRRLRLTNCVLPGDLSAPALAALPGLDALSLVPCAMGQVGMDQLAGALTRLQQLEIRVQVRRLYHCGLGCDWGPGEGVHNSEGAPGA